jgi:hypothetical protein
MASVPSRSAESTTPFGLPRQRTTRIEIIFTMKSGGHMTVFHDTKEPVTPESAEAYAKQLAEDLGRIPGRRFFSDDANHTGQHAWIDLGEVAAFAVRPAK